MIINLSKSINFNGTEYQELDLNLENLTGQDLINAEDNLRAKGIMTTGAADFSRNYLLAVASQALKIAPESLKELNAKDFTHLMNEVLIFLAGSGSGQSQSQNQEKESASAKK